MGPNLLRKPNNCSQPYIFEPQKKCYFSSGTSLNVKCKPKKEIHWCLWLLVWKLFSTIPHTDFIPDYFGVKFCTTCSWVGEAAVKHKSIWFSGSMCYFREERVATDYTGAFFNHFRSTDCSCHLSPICICCISRHRSPICHPQSRSCPVHPSFICQDSFLPCLKKKRKKKRAKSFIGTQHKWGFW